MNEILGWALVTAGFVSGGAIGLRFHDESWLGGYTAYPRRMIRLGHIAMVALGVLNLLVAIVGQGGQSGVIPPVAAWGFAVGGLVMPTGCFIAAARPRLRFLFVIPVASLVAGGVAMTLEAVRS